MALIQATRVGITSPGEVIASTTQDEVFTTAWTAGETITLTTVGTGVLVGTLNVNFQEKLLTRGVGRDYTFTAPNIITLLFPFDPTQYDPASVLIQTGYAYYV